jgi:hypothetical protein
MAYCSDPELKLPTPPPGLLFLLIFPSLFYIITIYIRRKDRPNIVR